MVLMHNNDMFIAKFNTLVADYDRDTLTNLYQPIIGHTALSLVLSLWSEANNLKIISPSTHESLMVKMQITPGEFVQARKALEAVGLLRTKVEETESGNIFYYNLFAPKTPNDFFEDTLLFGLLIKFVGDTEAEKYKKLYSINPDDSKGNEISASFNDVFHPNYEDPAFLKAIDGNKAKGRNLAKIKSQFTLDVFMQEIQKISQINEKGFTKKDYSEISRLATLYGINEEKAASIVVSFYDPSLDKGKRLDFSSISKSFQDETNYAYLSRRAKNGSNRKSISSKSLLASKIAMMETISPKDFLTVLQNGTQPATPDLCLIDNLSKKFHLENCVLNAIIDYVLTTNKNILSRPYCEKVAASLTREGITTTIDAMNYLNDVYSKTNSYSNKQAKKIIKPTNSKVIDKNVKENNDPSWDELLDSLALEEEEEGDHGEA